MIGLSQLRWSVTVGGDQHLPPQGRADRGERPTFALAPILAAFSISGVVDRPVRFIGRSDSAAQAARPSDRRSARSSRRGVRRAAGRRVGGLGAAPSSGLRQVSHVGRIKHEHVGAAPAGVQVYPAATTGSPIGRNARVEIGQATRPSRRRRGPLAELSSPTTCVTRSGGSSTKWARSDRNTDRLAAPERPGRTMKMAMT
jgi:hypothetical protein